MNDANLIGVAVQTDCGIFGVVEYINGKWAGGRGPFGRLDEIQVDRLIIDLT